MPDINPNSTGARLKSNTLLQRLYRWMLSPAPSIEAIAERHTARLLSSFLFVAITILLSFRVVATVIDPNYVFNPADLVGYALLAIAYGVSRTRWYRLSAWLMIGPIPILTLGSIAEGSDSNPYISLMYLVVALLLASIFFEIRGTILLAGLNAIVILWLPTAAEQAFPDYSSIISPFFAYLVAAVLVVVFLDHRSRIERERQAELKNTYDITLQGWATALELRDKETHGHSNRVTELTLILARALKVPTGELEHIRRGALLHDVGKMAISDMILTKTEPLTHEDWVSLRQHPVIAYEMLHSIKYLQPALDIPLYHHEKWDGTGYPEGLKGEEIPYFARIFAIPDVWDALSSDRPYRKAWPRDNIIDYMKEQSGKHFDPEVLTVFFALIEE